jgi:hypothetical protein
MILESLSQELGIEENRPRGESNERLQTSESDFTDRSRNAAERCSDARRFGPILGEPSFANGSLHRLAGGDARDLVTIAEVRPSGASSVRAAPLGSCYGVP